MERDKTKTKYLKLYYEWMKTGRITDQIGAQGSGGLCNTEIQYEALKIFTPELGDSVVPGLMSSYWASDSTNLADIQGNGYAFGPTRQNIVLLLAAMNNEL